MNRVVIIDYGMGNLHSVASALSQVAENVDVIITADHQTILNAHRVIFPGVGAMRDCMGEIKRLQLDSVIRQVIANQTPLLAICVGLQALMSFSEENSGVDCLNVFDGPVRFFGQSLQDSQGQRLKVPHMGWNQVQQVKTHPLWKNITDYSRFYFVHSYYVQPEQDDWVVGKTRYGIEFASVLARENIFATQFHPEKSATAGLTLFKNFLNWNGSV